MDYSKLKKEVNFFHWSFTSNSKNIKLTGDINFLVEFMYDEHCARVIPFFPENFDRKTLTLYCSETNYFLIKELVDATREFLTSEDIEHYKLNSEELRKTTHQFLIENFNINPSRE